MKIETINMAYEVLYFDMPLCLNRRLPQNTNTHQSVAALNCVNFIPDQDEDAVWPGIKKLPTPDLIPVHCDQSDGLSVTESLQSSNFSDEIDLIDAFKEVRASQLPNNRIKSKKKEKNIKNLHKKVGNTIPDLLIIWKAKFRLSSKLK